MWCAFEKCEISHRGNGEMAALGTGVPEDGWEAGSGTGTGWQETTCSCLSEGCAMGPWDSWWLPDSQGKAEQTWMCPQNGGLAARELEPGDGQNRDPASQFLQWGKLTGGELLNCRRSDVVPQMPSFPQ